MDSLRVHSREYQLKRSRKRNSRGSAVLTFDRFMEEMNLEKYLKGIPSYRTFGYFINEVLKGSIEEIFNDINRKIFETEHVNLLVTVQPATIPRGVFAQNVQKSRGLQRKVA